MVFMKKAVVHTIKNVRQLLLIYKTDQAVLLIQMLAVDNAFEKTAGKLYNKQHILCTAHKLTIPHYGRSCKWKQ